MKPLTLLALLLVLLVLISLGKGAVAISPHECLEILFQRPGVDAQKAAVLVSIRLPRIILAVLVGAGLGLSGSAMQGLFRNPLADPGLIGVSSGAMLASTAIFVLGDLAGRQWNDFLPFAAFFGALLATLLVYRLARTQERTMIATMLLAGIALNALAQAGASLLTFVATDTQIRSITFWRLGSLGGATWTTIWMVAPFILLPVLVLPMFANALNAFLLGESEAYHLGIHVERAKNLIIVLVAMAAGASVAVTGIIGFVGLIVPHLLRFLVGPDHRRLLPGSALLGASLVVGADVLSRTLVAPAELPIGILTALAGAPFFLWLLLREKRFA